MERTRLLEEDAEERWIYVIYDDQGRPIYLNRAEWEAIQRSSPEDQG